MFPRLLLTLALSLTCVACDSIGDFLGITTNETLSLDVAGPREHNSLEDDMGLGKLQVELSGAIERIFTAQDFPVEPFSVPDKGRVYVKVSLTFNGELDTWGVPALGRESWVLEPGHRWILRFARAEVPPAATLPSSEPGEYCNWKGCQEAWRIHISSHLRNYEEEALWVVLYGNTPCPEGAVCD